MVLRTLQNRLARLTAVLCLVMLVPTAALARTAENLTLGAGVNAPATQSKSNPGTSASASKPSKSHLLDINTASKSDLKALPGIGDAYSQKIIDGRPYNRKDDLVRRKIIPQAAYEKVKDQIIAHHVAVSDSKKSGAGKPK